MQCHGWGRPRGGRAGNFNAPSLRIVAPDRAALTEAIRCGRPGSIMPRWDRNAYTADAATSCYGQTVSAIGQLMPDPGQAFLTPQEISAVVDYLFAWVIGRGKPTVEECEVYNGAGSPACAPYR